MAVLDIRAFGGMAPSANAKNMPETTAIYANNMNLRFGDFRPMLAAAVASNPATAGQTLYKFEGNGLFITKPTVVNFVRGPIPTDATERTYYTGDGAPKVTDLTGAVRQLGVPRPTAAPTVAVNVTDEFSTEDSAAALPLSQAAIAGIIWGKIVHTYVGVDNANLANFIPSSLAWNFIFSVPGTMVSGAFVPTNPLHRNLMDDRLGFFLSTSGGTTTGNVNVFLRGAKMTFDASLATDLAAIDDPSDPGTAKLLTSDQVTAIVTGLTDGLKPADTACAKTIGDINQMKTEFVALANTGSSSLTGNIAAVKAFYQRSEILAATDDAVDQAISAIYNAMFTFNRS